MASKSYLPYRLDYLTEWLVDKANDELNETVELRNSTLEEFKILVTKNASFSIHWTNNKILLQFLRARKFNVKRALELFYNFHKTKKERLDIWPADKLDVETLRSFFDKGFLGNLSFRDKDGCAIILIKFGLWDPEVHSIATALSALTAVALHALQFPATQVSGVRVIWDMKGGNLKHLKHVKPKDIMFLGKGLKNALPIRVKGVHLVNISTVTKIFLNMAKMFLSEKLNRRILLHGENMAELHQFIPKEILPPEYGGENNHYNVNEWCKMEIETFYEKYSQLHS